MLFLLDQEILSQENPSRRREPSSFSKGQYLLADAGHDVMPGLDRGDVDLPDEEQVAANTLRARVQRNLLAWHFQNNPNLAG